MKEVVILVECRRGVVPFITFWRNIIPKSVSSRRVRRERVIADTPELCEIARTLASLALERDRQRGSLKVRQHEYLRRALGRAASAFRWELVQGSSAERMAAATKDVTELADAGACLLDSDLADLVASKREEIRQIQKVTESIRDLAGSADTHYPTEVGYSHTARDANGNFVTRTTTLSLSNADNAYGSAATLGKRMEGLEKLRDLMLEDLKDKRVQVRTMRRGLPQFIEFSAGSLGYVLSLPTEE